MTYRPPDDTNAYSNLDKFLKIATPKSLDDFKEASIYGIRVSLTHESTNRQEMQIYLPTLSSLYLSWHNGFVDYHETEPVFNRMPIH